MNYREILAGVVDSLPVRVNYLLFQDFPFALHPSAHAWSSPSQGRHPTHGVYAERFADHPANGVVLFLLLLSK